MQMIYPTNRPSGGINGTRKLTKPAVYIVEDDEAVANSLRWLVKSSGFEPLSFRTAREFLEAHEPARPGCLVLDVRLPDIGGLELLRILRSAHVHRPAIVVSGFRDVAAAVRAMKDGAMDFLTKPFDGEELLERVRSAVASDLAWRVEEAEYQELDHRFSQLTPKQNKVLKLMIEGLTSKEIAGVLEVRLKTVESHRGQILHKLEGRGLAQVVAMTLRFQELKRRREAKESNGEHTGSTFDAHGHATGGPSTH